MAGLMGEMALKMFGFPRALGKTSIAPIGRSTQQSINDQEPHSLSSGILILIGSTSFDYEKIISQLFIRLDFNSILL